MTQSKDFDHHGPTMMNGNGVLYEDLTHARPRLPMAPPSIEVNIPLKFLPFSRVLQVLASHQLSLEERALDSHFAVI